jgi:hypothetical protein
MSPEKDTQLTYYARLLNYFKQECIDVIHEIKALRKTRQSENSPSCAKEMYAFVVSVQAWRSGTL